MNAYDIGLLGLSQSWTDRIVSDDSEQKKIVKKKVFFFVVLMHTFRDTGRID